MKILIANIPTPGNRFLADLKDGFEKQNCEVVWDDKEFWNSNNNYDVIHIHWPEYLSFEIEGFLNSKKPIPFKVFDKLNQCLEYWKKKSKIIYTRHNSLPHSREDSDFVKLYYLVSSSADLITHFTNYSIEGFKSMYPQLTTSKHVVISHHNYQSLPNVSTKTEARIELGIAQNAKVMVVFGAVKEHEKKLIQNAFKYIPGKNKVLLAPRWKISRRKIKYIRLREWVWKYEKWKSTLMKNRRFNLGFIKEDDVQLYLNASDFLFIPRTNELNSGNIALACTFGLTVLGRNEASIGEILQSIDNPTFEVGNLHSLKRATMNTLELVDQGQGEKNRVIALTEWEPSKIAKSYCYSMQSVEYGK